MTKYPFSPEELTVVKTYPSAGMDRMTEQFRTPITARENLRAFVSGQTPCWMPDARL